MNHPLHAKDASLPPQPSSELFDLWDTYHKVVALDYMFHRDIGKELGRVLAERFSGRSFSFLDLGCGDAFTLAPLLREIPPSRYKGVDLSRTALALAAKNLEGLSCPIELAHGDIVAALADSSAYDVIHSSFVLHHLPTEGKAEFFRRAAKKLAPGGLLLLVDVAREEDEPLAVYHRNYCAWLRAGWGAMTAQELAAVEEHIVANDMPETFSTLAAQARAAGLTLVAGGAKHLWHRLMCFARA